MSSETEIWSGSISWKVALGSWKAWLTLGVYAWWMRRGTQYRITESKIQVRRGNLSKNTNSINLRDIQNIRSSQSAIERLLGYGDLEFSTAGTGGTEITFKNVPNPGKLKQRIQDKQRGSQQAVA